MKIAVLGAGLMGRAALYDVSSAEGVVSTGIYDIDSELASEIASKFGNDKTIFGQLDVSNEEALFEILQNFDSVISCVTYKYNLIITKAAIRAKCHMVDLGGNNDVVNGQLALDAEAKEAGVIIIPDCGLAPGLVSVLTADGIAKLETVNSVKIRVGGLPQSPRPPLNYQMVFSAEGLINEYWEPCVILENGQKKTVNPMTAIEELSFDGIGDLEAFYTSGGTSTLPDTYENKLNFLDYKTIRYPGHCMMFKPMLEIGLASRQAIDVDGQQVEPRSLLKAVLDKNLTSTNLDMTLVRVTIEGKKDGADKKIVFEIVDRQVSKESLTAMMRTTAFPAAIIAWMAAAGHIELRGCQPQEVVVNPSVFLPQLKKRNINLVIREE